MKKDIKIATIHLLPAHELALNAACSYFETNEKDLLKNSPNREHARKKGLVFYLLKKECQLTDNDIAKICNTTRQNVSYAVDKTDVRQGLYLQSACDYRNIKALFSHLLKEQEEWLKLHLP